MSTASISGGFHFRISVAVNDFPPKSGRSRSSAGAVASYAPHCSSELVSALLNFKSLIDAVYTFGLQSV